MSAGSRRSFINIEAPTTTTSDIGEPVITWANFASAWVSIQPNTGKETNKEPQIKAEVTHIIKTRFISGLNTKMRINFNGRTMGIDSIINVREESRNIEIMAVENV